MKKENFITLVLGTTGGLLLGIGMCMCLLPEWNAFTPGVVITAIGAIVLIAMFIVRRAMLGKPAFKVNPKTLGKIVLGILGVLVMGTGMCMVLVFEGMMIPGIIVGVVGIVLLLCLIPMCAGLK